MKYQNKSKEKKLLLTGKVELIHDINIGNMILNSFKSRPNFIGQINAKTDEKVTFQQMWRNSVKCAMWLQKSCVKGSVVSICTKKHMFAYIPYLASLYIGAIINPWEKIYFSDCIRVLYFLVQYKPKVMFVDREDYYHIQYATRTINQNGHVLNLPRIVTFDRLDGVDSLELIINDDINKDKIDQFVCERMNLTDIMAIMFSPNTNHYPGLMYMRYFALTFPSNQEVPVMSSGDTGLWYSLFVWPFNLILTVRSILSHVTMIRILKFEEEFMYYVIDKYKVKWMFLQSSICNQFFQTDINKYDFSSVKQLIFDDSDFYYNNHKRFIKYFTNASTTQIYSISEACIIAAYKSMKVNNVEKTHGYVAKNVQLMILDTKQLKIVGQCAQGQIWYRFLCKWCNGKICKSPFCRNYRAKKNNIDANAYFLFTSTWHCTEDYGYYKDDRQLVIVDQIKNLITYNNDYISPLKIENLLQLYPNVSEVTVGYTLDKIEGQCLIACIKKKSEIQIMSKKKLREIIDKNLPSTDKPCGILIFFTRDIFYLPNGKIDRNRTQIYSNKLRTLLNYSE